MIEDPINLGHRGHHIHVEVAVARTLAHDAVERDLNVDDRLVIVETVGRAAVDDAGPAYVPLVEPGIGDDESVGA